MIGLPTGPDVRGRPVPSSAQLWKVYDCRARCSCGKFHREWPRLPAIPRTTLPKAAGAKAQRLAARKTFATVHEPLSKRVLPELFCNTSRTRVYRPEWPKAGGDVSAERKAMDCPAFSADEVHWAAYLPSKRSGVSVGLRKTNRVGEGILHDIQQTHFPGNRRKIRCNTLSFALETGLTREF